RSGFSRETIAPKGAPTMKTMTTNLKCHDLLAINLLSIFALHSGPCNCFANMTIFYSEKESSPHRAFCRAHNKKSFSVWLRGTGFLLFGWHKDCNKSCPAGN
ncbi:MAG: hypothetical protein JW832_09370, partial [Deltaproteobacteria bacterium]|nr:hypothetical protein [Deltaproteobacteria bacterium]